MTLPYENATSGKGAIDDMQKIMRAFGATSFGCMEDYAKGEVLVQFEWKGKRVVMKANARGYAALWLRQHPWTNKSGVTREGREQRALQIGQTAVYSILRDWLKGQVTAVEVGMLTFEGAFLGQIMLPNGQTILERVEQEKLLQIEGKPE